MTVKSTKGKKPKIGETLLDDLNQGNFRSSINQDFRELKEFYIDEEQKKRLKNMGTFRRGLYMLWWLLKSMFFKLKPVQRLLLIVSLFFLLSSTSVGFPTSGVNSAFLGGVILLFILMIELKDKLLARNELEAGRSVQYALMPERNPQIPGWDAWVFTRPANDVGGDLVDFLKMPGERYGLALADVAGKGLGAALLMAKLQSTIRALAPDYMFLANLCKKVNEIFYRDTLPSSFASLVYLEPEAKGAAIRLVNAGHQPPLIVKSEGIRELQKGSTAVGMTLNTFYEEYAINLTEDELLVVYSDGLTEAQNANEEFFGEDRLFKLLPRIYKNNATAIGEALLAEIDRFNGDIPFHDDLSLIILRRN